MKSFPAQLARSDEHRLAEPLMEDVEPKPISARKRAIVEATDRLAPAREKWRRKAAFFHTEDERYLRFLIPKGQSILEIGCGTGDTLASLEPRLGIGIDISANMILDARRK